MPINQTSLTTAAFWGERICLACGTPQTEGDDLLCQECESPSLVDAAQLARFIDALEEADERR